MFVHEQFAAAACVSVTWPVGDRVGLDARTVAVDRVGDDVRPVAVDPGTTQFGTRREFARVDRSDRCSDPVDRPADIAPTDPDPKAGDLDRDADTNTDRGGIYSHLDRGVHIDHRVHCNRDASGEPEPVSDATGLPDSVDEFPVAGAGRNLDSDGGEQFRDHLEHGIVVGARRDRRRCWDRGHLRGEVPPPQLTGLSTAGSC